MCGDASLLPHVQRITKKQTPMKVFVVTYPCAEGRIECRCRRALQTEVHQTLEAAEAATEGRMFVQILECEVGASWQSSTQTWSPLASTPVKE